MQRVEVVVRRVHWMAALAPLLVVVPAHFFVDQKVARWAHEQRLEDVRVLQWVTELGESTWWLIAAGVVFLITALAKRDNTARWAFAFFAAVAGSGVLGNLLKLCFGKARPIRLLEAGEFGFSPFSYGHAVNSFPSGHATTFGALAMMFALLFPRFWVAFLVIGAAGASTRALIHAHYVSDVCAGYMFGMVCALLVFAVWRRWWPTSVPVRFV